MAQARMDAEGLSRSFRRRPRVSMQMARSVSTERKMVVVKRLLRGYRILWTWRLCQCSNRLFPLPLTRLCCCNKSVSIVGIHDARVLSDIRYLQEIGRASCRERV